MPFYDNCRTGVCPLIGPDHDVGKSSNLSWRCLVAGCGRGFTTERGLNVHKSAMHSSKRADAAEMEYQWRCTFHGCDKVTKTERGLKCHYTTCHRSSRTVKESVDNQTGSGSQEVTSGDGAGRVVGSNALADGVMAEVQEPDGWWQCAVPGCDFRASLEVGLKIHVGKCHRPINGTIDMPQTEGLPPRVVLRGNTDAFRGFRRWDAEEMRILAEVEYQVRGARCAVSETIAKAMSRLGSDRSETAIRRQLVTAKYASIRRDLWCEWDQTAWEGANANSLVDHPEITPPVSIGVEASVSGENVDGL